jgi:hypothetical protein
MDLALLGDIGNPGPGEISLPRRWLLPSVSDAMLAAGAENQKHDSDFHW